MKLIFIDDSVHRQPRRTGLGELVALGAVIVPEDQVSGFAADLVSIKTRLTIPQDEEIKWNPPRGSFLATADGEIASQVRGDVLSAAIARGIRSVVHVLDHSLVYKDRTVVEVGQELLKWTYDKIAFELEGQGAVMIADKPGGGTAQESRWLADTLALTNDGTGYTSPGKVVLPVLTAGSHHVPHLQLADIVTASTTAAIAGRRSGQELTPLLRQLACKNRGYVGGAGITLWPPELRDLLYWEFGEDLYVTDNTPLGPSGMPFSSPSRPFREQSGIPSGPFRGP